MPSCAARRGGGCTRRRTTRCPSPRADPVMTRPASDAGRECSHQPPWEQPRDEPDLTRCGTARKLAARKSTALLGVAVDRRCGNPEGSRLFVPPTTSTSLEEHMAGTFGRWSALVGLL